MTQKHRNLSFNTFMMHVRLGQVKLQISLTVVHYFEAYCLFWTEVYKVLYEIRCKKYLFYRHSKRVNKNQQVSTNRPTERSLMKLGWSCLSPAFKTF